jgi:hypothetical protein
MRDMGSEPKVLSIEIWPDGSAKSKVDDNDLIEFVRFCKTNKIGVERIVKMLREAAVIIESGCEI